MIYREPQLTARDQAVLDLIGLQRSKLKHYTEASPRRWIGSLRRTGLARAIRGSNSIEGYLATLDQAVDAVDAEPPFDERTETWAAISGYRNALTCIMQAAGDPYFEFSKQFLKSLHFMMIGHDMSKRPGQWRLGTIFVADSHTEEMIYEGPDIDDVDRLMGELVATLGESTDTPALVKAAMAHLNLAMIHPFKDGNGRMARALQTLVLAREGLLHPVFSSIEEWLGRHTEDYYKVLRSMSNGTWAPDTDTRPWIEFCLKAHYQQALIFIRRNEEYSALFEQIEELLRAEALPDRAVLPLLDAATGLRLTNARYQREADVSMHIATRDLKTLSGAGLLIAHGEKRGRYYMPSDTLAALRQKVRANKPVHDPYELVDKGVDGEPRLPGL
ncbi:MAG: Fic family protein [Pseudomonadota bacterium]